MESISEQVFEAAELLPAPASANPELQPYVNRSWIFRTVDFSAWTASTTYGIISIVFLLAVSANIPIVQFMAFG
jgi:hypothetical protein